MIHSIIQVLPTNEYKVYIYFANGKVKLYDANDVIEKGIFTILKDKKIFIDRCTVLNNTLAWDIKGDYNSYDCIDLDPEVLYNNSITVEDPLKGYA